jgi:hypothetical protein
MLLFVDDDGGGDMGGVKFGEVTLIERGLGLISSLVESMENLKVTVQSGKRSLTDYTNAMSSLSQGKDDIINLVGMCMQTYFYEHILIIVEYVVDDNPTQLPFSNGSSGDDDDVLKFDIFENSDPSCESVTWVGGGHRMLSVQQEEVQLKTCTGTLPREITNTQHGNINVCKLIIPRW